MDEAQVTARRIRTSPRLAEVDVAEVIGLDRLGQLKAYEEARFPAPPIMSTLAMQVSTEPASATVGLDALAGRTPPSSCMIFS